MTTFGDLSDENQKKLIEQIEAETEELSNHKRIEIPPIPPHDERQKCEIRELTRLLRKNKMEKSIQWMKDNLPKGITG